MRIGQLGAGQRISGLSIRRGRQTSSILVLPAEGDLSTSGQARGMVQEIYTGSYSNIQTFHCSEESFKTVLTLNNNYYIITLKYYTSEQR